MKYKNRTNCDLLLQLPLVGFKSGFEAFLHAVGGVGGATDGIHFLAEGFVDGEAIPSFKKTAFHNVLGEFGRFLVFAQGDQLWPHLRERLQTKCHLGWGGVCSPQGLL